MSKTKTNTIQFGHFTVLIDGGDVKITEWVPTGNKLPLRYSKTFDNAVEAHQVVEALHAAHNCLMYETFKTLLCAAISMPTY